MNGESINGSELHKPTQSNLPGRSLVLNWGKSCFMLIFVKPLSAIMGHISSVFTKLLHFNQWLKFGLTLDEMSELASPEKRSEEMDKHKTFLLGSENFKSSMFRSLKRMLGWQGLDKQVSLPELLIKSKNMRVRKKDFQAAKPFVQYIMCFAKYDECTVKSTKDLFGHLKEAALRKSTMYTDATTFTEIEDDLKEQLHNIQIGLESYKRLKYNPNSLVEILLDNPLGVAFFNAYVGEGSSFLKANGKGGNYVFASEIVAESPLVAPALVCAGLVSSLKKADYVITEAVDISSRPNALICTRTIHTTEQRRLKIKDWLGIDCFAQVFLFPTEQKSSFYNLMDFVYSLVKTDDEYSDRMYKGNYTGFNKDDVFQRQVEWKASSWVSRLFKFAFERFARVLNFLRKNLLEDNNAFVDVTLRGGKHIRILADNITEDGKVIGLKINGEGNEIQVPLGSVTQQLGSEVGVAVNLPANIPKDLLEILKESELNLQEFADHKLNKLSLAAAVVGEIPDLNVSHARVKPLKEEMNKYCRGLAYAKPKVQEADQTQAKEIAGMLEAFTTNNLESVFDSVLGIDILDEIEKSKDFLKEVLFESSEVSGELNSAFSSLKAAEQAKLDQLKQQMLDLKKGSITDSDVNVDLPKEQITFLEFIDACKKHFHGLSENDMAKAVSLATCFRGQEILMKKFETVALQEDDKFNINVDALFETKSFGCFVGSKLLSALFAMKKREGKTSILDEPVTLNKAKREISKQELKKFKVDKVVALLDADSSV